MLQDLTEPTRCREASLYVWRPGLPSFLSKRTNVMRDSPLVLHHPQSLWQGLFVIIAVGLKNEKSEREVQTAFNLFFEFNDVEMIKSGKRH